VIVNDNYESFIVITKQILTKSGASFICVGISSTVESSPFLIPIDPINDIEGVRLDKPSQVI
jgi:hypothetical protein